MAKDKLALVKVYLRNPSSVCYEYTVNAKTPIRLDAKIREHLDYITTSGYKHRSKDTIEWFLPHWIDKVRVTGDVSVNTLVHL